MWVSRRAVVAALTPTGAVSEAKDLDPIELPDLVRVDGASRIYGVLMSDDKRYVVRADINGEPLDLASGLDAPTVAEVLRAYLEALRQDLTLFDIDAVIAGATGGPA